MGNSKASYVGAFWDVLGCPGSFWDDLGCFGIFWDLGTLDVLRGLGIWVVCVVCVVGVVEAVGVVEIVWVVVVVRLALPTCRVGRVTS